MIIGNIMKILTQVVLVPLAQKALNYFFYKLEQHDKKIQEKENK